MTETLEIKQQLKDALYEFFREDNDYLRNVISDVMQDIALGKAMEEGDKGDYVDERLILEILNK